MKRLFVIFSLLLLNTLLYAQAQQMSVKDFFLAQTDLTANTPGTMVQDQNGNLCALIKVETTLDDFSFDVGSLGVTDVRRVGGELWVYVPYGIKKITISHPKLGIIRDYAFGERIEKGRTYILKLSTPVANRAYDKTKRRKLNILVSPAEAYVELNDVPLDNDKGGVYHKDCYLGIWDILVEAPRYHSQRVQVDIVDGKTAFVSNISLKPKFGWLTLSGEGDETLYIENKPQPFTPGKSIELDSGTYRIRMEKPLHLPYETIVQMTDSLCLNITPELVPIYKDLTFHVGENAEIIINDKFVGRGTYREKLEYGTYDIRCRKNRYSSTRMTLTVNESTTGPINLETPQALFRDIEIIAADGADIYIDDKYVGRGRYSKDLDFGTYRIECRKDRHRSTYRILEVDAMAAEVIELDKPEPIMSYIMISSDPDRADVYIDGKHVGQTPYQSETIIGTYSVTLKKDRFSPYTQNVEVTEMGGGRLHAEMDETFKVLISSKPDKSSIFLDDEYAGKTSGYINVTAGKHKVRVSSDESNWMGSDGKYLDKTKTINFTKADEQYNFRLRKDPYKTKWFEGGAALNLGGGYNSKSYFFGIYLWHLFFGLEWYDSFEYYDKSFDGMSINVGYNIPVGDRFHIRPTLGFANFASVTPDYDPQPATTFIPGVKLCTAIIKNFELSVIPQYYIPGYESTYPYNKGFRLNVGLIYYLNLGDELWNKD